MAEIELHTIIIIDGKVDVAASFELFGTDSERGGKIMRLRKLNKTKVLYMTFVCLLLFSTLALAEDPVNIPDAALKAAIKEKLGITDPEIDPTASDMSSMTGSLHVESSGVADLTGLEYAVNLTQLYLSGNQIVDVSPLAGLENLTVLNLYNNLIVDISPLAGLTNLGYLSLGDNQISSIDALEGMTNLHSLNLNSNNIDDISVLGGLGNLTNYLYLGLNQISDISALSAMTNLANLVLRFNNIEDISALTGLTALTGLDLVHNPINLEGYCEHIPTIETNNDGVALSYDALPPVNIPDPALKAAIKEKLGITDP